MHARGFDCERVVITRYRGLEWWITAGAHRLRSPLVTIWGVSPSCSEHAEPPHNRC